MWGVGTGGSLQVLKHPTEFRFHGESTAKMKAHEAVQESSSPGRVAPPLG